MPSQRSLQRGHRVRGGQKEVEGGVDLQQTSLAMNFDLRHQKSDQIVIILSPNHQVSGHQWPPATLSLYPYFFLIHQINHR